jgi:hypothetical protein
MKKGLTPKQSKLLSAYIAAAQKLGRHPTRSDMLQVGYSRDSIRAAFTSLQNLKKVAKSEQPRAFLGIIEDVINSPERKKSLATTLKNYKRFVVTTVVSGCPVHKGFLKSLKTYCKKNRAALLLLPANGSVSDMDPALSGEHFIFEDTNLNSNLHLSSIKVNSKSVNPLTGLSRIGQRNGSVIVASPKQFMEFVPTGDNKLPHVVMSTGALTKSAYTSGKGEIKRVDYIAAHDHMVGAVVVEIEDNKIFHFRQIQSEKGGSFVDLGVYYQGDQVGTLAPEAFSLGDTHVLETDPTAMKAWREVSKATGCRRVVHHDLFSGLSVNHHEENRNINRALLAMQNGLSLEEELKSVAKFIDEETSQYDEVVIVDSNHHDFITRYLQEGKYLRDPQNFFLAHKLVSAMAEGKDPFRYAIETLVGLKSPKKVRWLKRDESYRIAGIELGAHGDKGANGAKGSATTLEKAYGNCVVGHSHSPKILRGFWQNGTSSFLRLPYTQGSSSWFHSSTLIYKNGARQMVHSIGGKWRVK